MSEPIIGGCPTCACPIHLVKETGRVRPTCKCQGAEFIEVRVWEGRHIMAQAGTIASTEVKP